MIKILDYLINALVLWRSKIAIQNQVQDLAALDGKPDPATAGFEPVKRFDWLSDVEALQRIEKDVLGTDEEIKKDALKRAEYYAMFGTPERAGANGFADHVEPKADPVYFPGLTEQEIKDLQKKQKEPDPC